MILLCYTGYARFNPWSVRICGGSTGYPYQGNVELMPLPKNLARRLLEKKFHSICLTPRGALESLFCIFYYKMDRNYREVALPDTSLCLTFHVLTACCITSGDLTCVGPPELLFSPPCEVSGGGLASSTDPPLQPAS